MNSPSPRAVRWRAALMSMVLPGFGQLHNGRPNRAIWIFLAFSLLSVPAMAWIATRLPVAWTLSALLASLAATLGLWFYSIVDAWRGAATRAIRPWQTGGLYALVFVLCAGLVLPLTIEHVRSRYVASWRIPSASMSPGILPGDILFADMSYNCPGCRSAVGRGDVVILTYPNDRTLSYIKRVVGLPGDRVRIEGRRVWVNDVPLEAAEGGQDVLRERLDGRSWTVSWREAPADQAIDLMVPPGTVYVLADNRGQGRDSRHFGAVPLRDVVGRARQIWFSSSAAAGVRWSRLGMAVD